MEITGKKEILKSHVRTWKQENKLVGFVPTMGALHAGHISLIREAKQHCDVVVVSIFVNPLQFNNSLDLEKYPRNLDTDLDLLKDQSVDLVYAPLPEEFYPQIPKTTLDFGSVSNGLEGKMRPGHFSGVGIVVSRLFNLVEPGKAFFGAKDLQQFAVIKSLVVDLGFEIEIIRCPTFREENGLAMSSRNARLSRNGLETASKINKALSLAIDHLSKSGLDDAKNLAANFLYSDSEIKMEYLEWVDPISMEIIQKRPEKGEIAICIAAWVEGIRLIDNMIV